MREEIAAAVVFITRLVRENAGLPKEKVGEFSDCLSAILVERFKNHWFSDNPSKGQGYRCIRMTTNHQQDPVLRKSAVECQLDVECLCLPVELIVWVDPEEVTCRLGEHKSNQCLVASFKEGQTENNALTLDITTMMEKYVDDEAKNLKYVCTRINKKHIPHYSKSYSPTNEWVEKGYHDKEDQDDLLWIEDVTLNDQYHYYFKDIRDKRVYLKQQHNYQNRSQQAQHGNNHVNNRYHYQKPNSAVFSSSSTALNFTTKQAHHRHSSQSPACQHVHVNSSGGTTFYRPIVKNRYHWVRESPCSSPTIAA